MKATKKKLFAGLLSMVLALSLGTVIPITPVKAASGTVYTCTVNPCYAHPVTGEIEDSGGEASYATGQGMIEGAVYTTGILEVTDSGEYYLTIRMSLMDLTSGHSFWVQNLGDSGWSAPAMGVTGNGSDSNGTTADICIQVPSENCVVRGSMYVDPMGRDVIFYCYPSNFSEGNSTDMNATMVTSAAGSDAAANVAPADNSGASTVTADNTGSDNSGASNLQAQAAQETTATPTPVLTAAPVQSQAADADGEDKDKKTTKLQSRIDTPATPSAEEPSTDSTLNKSQGLSLSTAEEGSGTVEAEGNGSGSQAVTLIIAITVSGLILMGAAAGIVYLFRKNWRRWGGGDDDDE